MRGNFREKCLKILYDTDLIIAGLEVFHFFVHEKIECAEVFIST